jgi:2-oxoglutarate ferredoxin oxidoreductase subunit gamma
VKDCKLGTIEHVFAGFGGQGVLFIGRVLAHAALVRNVNTSFIPSYGPEMRGGTANCKVVVSGVEVGSPIVETPDVLVALNRPSLEKFEKMVKAGGMAIVNSSLIEIPVGRKDVNAVYVPCNDLAKECGDSKVANLCALGALVAKQSYFTVEDMEAGIEAVIGGKRSDMLDVNKKALRAGYEYVKSRA